MSPARDYVTEVLGFDPENASPTSVVSGERFLVKLACVALLAHVRVDDVELVALAAVLHATGRVEAL